MLACPPGFQVRITSQGKSRSYISYGTSLLTEKGHSSVVLKAMGKAINKTVTIGACPPEDPPPMPAPMRPQSSPVGPWQRGPRRRRSSHRQPGLSRCLRRRPSPTPHPPTHTLDSLAAEIMKRRIAGLHQHTAIASVELRDQWVPKEEGLDPIETTRHVSVIAITLSKVGIGGWRRDGRVFDGCTSVPIALALLH